MLPCAPSSTGRARAHWFAPGCPWVYAPGASSQAELTASDDEEVTPPQAKRSEYDAARLRTLGPGGGAWVTSGVEVGLFSRPRWKLSACRATDFSIRRTHHAEGTPMGSDRKSSDTTGN